jgi:hypothetical protein
MNKKHIILVLIMVAIASIYGCGLHSGYMASSAALGSANFSYSKMNAKGTASAKYILGIGGLDKNNLVNAAKQNLLATNPLEANQALVNITVNFKTEIYFLIYIKVKCIVTADFVTFNK